MTDYLKLPKVVKVRGIGIPQLTMTLIKEYKQVKMYLRDDGVYEVGIVTLAPAAEIFGKQYPDREQIWGSEDFGATAATTHSKEHADELFEMFKTKLDLHEQNSDSSEGSKESTATSIG